MSMFIHTIIWTDFTISSFQSHTHILLKHQLKKIRATIPCPSPKLVNSLQFLEISTLNFPLSAWREDETQELWLGFWFQLQLHRALKFKSYSRFILEQIRSGSSFLMSSCIFFKSQWKILLWPPEKNTESWLFQISTSLLPSLLKPVNQHSIIFHAASKFILLNTPVSFHVKQGARLYVNQIP